MYNRLKTMVNQVHNLRSTKWDNHEVDNLIIWSLVFCNPIQVQLIRENPSVGGLPLLKVLKNVSNHMFSA
jgi:hypothetical protein